VLANGIAEPLRDRGLGVERLRARDGAGPADIACALLPDVRAEREWLADAMARRWFEHVEATGAPPTAAILVRRRADMPPLAAALRARGLPVEVVGLGGLLDEPEVADLVSTLRVLADPLSGTAAARLLTGARWRIAAADLARLWRRASDLSRPPGAPEEAPAADPLLPERAEQTGLVDALDDPGDPARYGYSPQGYRRIGLIRKELAALRRRLDQSLPELVGDVERTMLLDVESLARPGSVGRAHLDAFADVVTEYAETAPTATLLSFLDYLTTASHAEDGLAPGEVEVAPDRVQVLTAHSAKGLEWQVVGVPHLVRDVFPGKRRSSSWLRTPTSLPAVLRGDAEDLPRLRVSAGMDRKEILEGFTEHEEGFAEREAEEERRLCYVALTRSEHALLVSGHWWNETSAKYKGPSTFLIEAAELLAPADGAEPIGTIEAWAPEPAPDEENPLVADSRAARWPADPLGGRRVAVAEGAAMVLDELAALELDEPPDGEDVIEQTDPDGWIADTDVLLAERARASRQVHEIALPDRLSVSQLVELATDPEELARRLRRPLPVPPNTYARRGTAFHGWLERRFGGERLLELEDLPGAADTDAAGDDELVVLQDAFEASAWANRVPHDVEVPFSTDVDGVTLRGRMDAVFADPDGGWTVVDWKTGAVPEGDRLRPLAVQLAAYRLAWSALAGVPLEKVRAAFHYVRHDRTVRPVDLLDADGLRDLLRSVPEG
jgi:DNA helicase-2/ATP-dependent DNA helicase PcrA